MNNTNCEILNKDQIGDDIQVSIYCLAYNHEKFISTAIESFLMQETSFRYMIYIHDDASTDGTPDIIRDYARKYPDKIVAILQKENQYSRNVKIDISVLAPLFRGKYVACCEGDDYWTDPGKLQQQFAYMENNPQCPLVVHESIRVSEKGEFVSNFSPFRFSDASCKMDVEAVLKHINDFHTSSLFFRNAYYAQNIEFLKEIGSFDYVMKTMLATDMPGDVYVIPTQMSAYRVAVSGSWTKRVQDHTQKNLQHIQRSIDALRAIDAYRQYAFHEEIEHEITRRRFRMEILSANRAAWSDPGYRDIIADMRPKERLTTWLQIFAPGVLQTMLVAKRVFRDMRKTGKP